MDRDAREKHLLETLPWTSRRKYLPCTAFRLVVQTMNMGRKKNPDIQLYYAVVHGNLKRIKHLVYNEGVSVNQVFMDGSLPLHVAAERGFVEIVTFLLSMKALTDSKNEHGQTALMLGIGYPPIVKVFLPPVNEVWGKVMFLQVFVHGGASMMSQ